MQPVRETQPSSNTAYAFKVSLHYIKIFSAKGHINDEVFEQLGFNQDHNIKDDIVCRTATISQEYMQRAKCLTHLHQSTLQLNRISQIEIKEKRKLDDKDTQVLSKVAANDKCCVCLRRMLGLDVTLKEVKSHLVDVTIEMFGHLFIPQLVRLLLFAVKPLQLKAS